MDSRQTMGEDLFHVTHPPPASFVFSFPSFMLVFFNSSPPSSTSTTTLLSPCLLSFLALQPPHPPFPSQSVLSAGYQVKVKCMPLSALAFPWETGQTVPPEKKKGKARGLTALAPSLCTSFTVTHVTVILSFLSFFNIYNLVNIMTHFQSLKVTHFPTITQPRNVITVLLKYPAICICFITLLVARWDPLWWNLKIYSLQMKVQLRATALFSALWLYGIFPKKQTPLSVRSPALLGKTNPIS